MDDSVQNPYLVDEDLGLAAIPPDFTQHLNPIARNNADRRENHSIPLNAGRKSEARYVAVPIDVKHRRLYTHTPIIVEVRKGHLDDLVDQQEGSDAEQRDEHSAANEEAIRNLHGVLHAGTLKRLVAEPPELRRAQPATLR